MTECYSCHKEKPNMVTAMINSVYYPLICRQCLGADETSSLAAAHNRYRDYEDNAQDTIQPYDSAGNANPEFLRLYPVQAKRVYSAEVIESLKRKL